MRATNLLRVAIEAELLRYRHMLKRQGLRVALALVGVVFLLSALAFADAAGWQFARFYVTPMDATLIMLGVNLLIAIIFVILASRSSVSKVERDAIELRQQALREARTSLALGAVIPIAGSLLRSRRRQDGRRPFWRRFG